MKIGGSYDTRKLDNDEKLMEEEKELMDSLGISEAILEVNEETSNQKTFNTMAACGISFFMVANLGILFSVIPVLRGKGAPYLPTFQKNLDYMFGQLRANHYIQKKISNGRELCFVDLGCGDGRVIFRAAREGLYNKSIGYEINPFLYAWCQTLRIIRGPKYWTSTKFVLCDIWKVSLRNVDVVAVYGLGPIMTELGKKLRQDLQDGSVVVSNVFEIPNWQPSEQSANGVHIYTTPCWNNRQKQQPLNGS